MLFSLGNGVPIAQHFPGSAACYSDVHLLFTGPYSLLEPALGFMGPLFLEGFWKTLFCSLFGLQKPHKTTPCTCMASKNYTRAGHAFENIYSWMLVKVGLSPRTFWHVTFDTCVISCHLCPRISTVEELSVTHFKPFFSFFSPPPIRRYWSMSNFFFLLTIHSCKSYFNSDATHTPKKHILLWYSA